MGWLFVCDCFFCRLFLSLRSASACLLVFFLCLFVYCLFWLHLNSPLQQGGVHRVAQLARHHGSCESASNNNNNNNSKNNYKKRKKKKNNNSSRDGRGYIWLIAWAAVLHGGKLDVLRPSLHENTIVEREREREREREYAGTSFGLSSSSLFLTALSGVPVTRCCMQRIRERERESE